MTKKQWGVAATTMAVLAMIGVVKGEDGLRYVAHVVRDRLNARCAVVDEDGAVIRVVAEPQVKLNIYDGHVTSNVPVALTIGGESGPTEQLYLSGEVNQGPYSVVLQEAFKAKAAERRGVEK